MSAIGSKAALQEGVEAITREAAGAVHVYVVRPADALGLMQDALSGSDEAGRILQAATQAQELIISAPRRSPMLCASCPAPLQNSQYAFVLAIPATGSPHQALGMAVCKRCGRDSATIKRKGVAALARIWPDLREIMVSHPQGGRA